MSNRAASMKWIGGLGVALLSFCGSCYNPKIGEGDFLCGPSPGLSCPAGFKCIDGRCYKQGGPSQPGDGAMGAMDTMMTMSSDAAMCLGPVMCSSSKSSGACDLVCQQGCKCNERCTVGTSGVTCVEATAPPRGDGETCDARTDNCRAGSICLEEVRSECGAHCYRFCRAHADCGTRSRCVGEATFGNAKEQICSPPIELCSPVGLARCSSVSGTAFGCYILSAEFADLTVCDCAGNLPEGQACVTEHQCNPGLECIKLPGETHGTCRPVCRLGAAPGATGACRVGACNPFITTRTSTVYGYCL
jgi:hypothetical protein